ncbi:MAG TPA: bifunctional 5,10-methylenetetrahydrofolate dehydrogenase/5,10-methenyltetrahydrofolate cyclohydrolase [Candidatus Saccharimonadales bacterium]|nr:bifunctional 5,10-methylenetetrahydrofolate dehydrogenase/5,10-methenyltetrahydrofolate cyclohydrolase [Candidatus Saccharimonadales bacterium]
MEINGTDIAKRIYAHLQERVDRLKKKKIIPHLVVILVGEHPASVAYVTLKQKKAEQIGAKVTILQYKTDVTTDELREKIQLLNDDPYVHGILVQRPLPDQIDVNALEMTTNPEKDIDGFHPKSSFTLPLPLSVVKILEETYQLQHPGQSSTKFHKWLQDQNITLLGKGPTGGGPIIAHLKTLNVTPHLIDSKTKNPDEIMKQADIMISAVGKRNTVKATDLKKGVILISVGLSRGEDKKLHGDYEVTEIKDIASYYTPTPGGVGPVNVAMLMENLLTAAEKQTKN